jgi:hypothetical protein
MMVFLAPLPVNAMPASLNPADIQNFAQIGSSGNGTPVTFKTSQSAPGAGFTTIWNYLATWSE